MQINIWEERKVFGSRGLKAEFLGRNMESGNRNGKDSGLKLVSSKFFISSESF